MSEIVRYTPDTFPFDWFSSLGLQKRGPGNPRSRQKIQYWDLLTAFDIETTRLPDIEQSFMYIWQWSFGPEKVVIGRTWEEFKLFLERLQSILGSSRLVVWVHNLSFEFVYLSGVLSFETDNVFAVREDRGTPSRTFNTESKVKPHNPAPSISCRVVSLVNHSWA